MSYDLFISYARRDNTQGRVTELVERIAADYRAFAGEELRCFFDQTEIHAMEDWRLRILQGLRESHLFLLVLSPAYLDSDYCAWEVVEFLKFEHSRAVQGQGVAQVYFVEIPGKGDAALEARLGAWYARLRRRNYADLRPWYDAGERALQQADVRARLADLERKLHHRLSRLRRITEAPGNLPSHNRHFVGREEQMERLHHSAGVGQYGLLTAVQGLGGLGKTALAVQYAYAYADFYPGGRWLVQCAGRTTLADALRSLDLELGLELTEAEQRDPVRAAKRVLAALEARARAGAEARAGEAEPPEPRALLLLDNVDDPALLQPPETDLTAGRHWLHLIATTRIAPERIGLPDHDYTHVAVDELPDDDALRLIERLQPNGRFASDDERAAAQAIVRLLQGFTLAVEVVAVFLGERARRIGCAALLQRLRAKGIDDIAGDTRSKHRIAHGEKLVSLTLTPTLETLAAAELQILTVAALCPPDLVALPWVRAVAGADHPELTRDAEPGYDDPWLDAVNHLIGLRLLQVVDWAEDGRTPRLCRIHRLVAETVRQQHQLRTEGLLDALLEHVADRAEYLGNHWQEPNAQWELRPLSQLALNPSIQHRPQAAKLTNESAVIAWYLGDYVECRRQMKHNVAIHERSSNPDLPELASAYQNLGEAERALGNLPEAQRLQKEALAIRKEALPPDHRDLARSHNYLGLVEDDLGHAMAAKQHYEQAIAIFETDKGANAKDLWKTYNNLAIIERGAGNHGAAKSLHQKALKTIKEIYPDEHPLWAYGYHGLASVEKDLGNLEEAKRLYQQALAIWEQALPAGHPSLATGYTNLASVERALGNLGEAKDLYRKALAIEEQALPANHPNLSLHFNNLALISRNTGDPAEAETMLRRAIAIEQQSLPSDSPKHPHRLNNLCTTLIMQHKLAEARLLLVRAWEMQAGRHDLTSARILASRVMVCLLDNELPAPFIGQLKTLLADAPLTAAGDIALKTNAGPVIDSLRPRLSDEQAAFLDALYLALNEPDQRPALDGFGPWREQQPVPLDAPWLDAPATAGG